MTKGADLTVRLKPEIRANLDALARDTKRSAAHLANEAIETYLDLNAWQAEHIRSALAEDHAGGPTVSHEDVVRWVRSWGSAQERPRPAPKKS